MVASRDVFLYCYHGVVQVRFVWDAQAWLSGLRVEFKSQSLLCISRRCGGRFPTPRVECQELLLPQQCSPFPCSPQIELTGFLDQDRWHRDAGEQEAGWCQGKDPNRPGSSVLQTRKYGEPQTVSNAMFARTSLGLQERAWATCFPQNIQNIQGDYHHCGADFMLSPRRVNISPFIHNQGAERRSHHMPVPAKLTCNLNPRGITKPCVYGLYIHAPPCA